MRNPAVANIYGHGKSRSKPLCKRPTKNIIAQQKGYQKSMALYEAVIKKTAPVRIIKLSKLSLGIKKGIYNIPKNIVKSIGKSKSEFKLNFGK